MLNTIDKQQVIRNYLRRHPEPPAVAAIEPHPDEPAASRSAIAPGMVILSSLTVWVAGWLLYRWLIRPAWLELLPPLLTELVTLLQAAGTVTLLFVWGGLWWRRQVRVGGPALDLGKLVALSPAAFERYVAGLFRQKGYRVRLRGRSGDRGVDLELTAGNGRRAIVQCKRYRGNIGPQIVRELYGTLLHERAARAFLVTTGQISAAAREWALGKPLTLIDGATLVAIADALRQEQGKPEPSP